MNVPEISSNESIEKIKGTLKEILIKMLPTTEIDQERDKNEIWEDLSHIYFKYDSEAQKKAFREVIKEINEKIRDDKWDELYNKIYRKNIL